MDEVRTSSKMRVPQFRVPFEALERIGSSMHVQKFPRASESENYGLPFFNPEESN
jgi:hypothetical protein